MNKNNSILASILASAALIAAACTADDYNEAFLDGFDPKPEISDIQTVAYTLADADYAAIANNKTNEAIAKQEGEEALNALKAVGKSRFFTDAAPAKKYLPAFLSQAYSNYMSDGSRVTVTHRAATQPIDEVVKLAAADNYVVSNENYKEVWGETPANFFTPQKPLETFAPRFLAAKFPEAQEGTVKIVRYNYSDSEPDTGGGDEAVTSIDENFAAGLSAWQIVKGESSASWVHDLQDGVNSAKVSAHNTQGPQDLWLISGKVNLATADAPKLAFDVKVSFWKHDGLQVLVATDYNGVDPELASWTDLTHCFALDGETRGKWYTPGICDMAPYKGKSIHIAFRYRGNAAEEKTTTYQITNIQLGDGVVTAAEKQLLGDTFENLDKWTVKAVADESKQWEITSNSGNFYAQASANGAAGAVESWLVTKDPIAVPAFDAEGMTVLGFDLKIGYWNADCLTILASENYTGDVAAAQWTDLTGYFLLPQGPTGSFADNFSAAGLASLYKFAGKSIHVAFKYTGNGADPEKKSTTYQVDNVKVASLSRAAAPTRADMTRAAQVKERNKAYTFDGAAWIPTPDTEVVNPEDYEAMGSSHHNFSESFAPETYLPALLAGKYPYAQPDQTKDVAYLFYASKETSLRADRYAFDGAAWKKVEPFEVVESPFKKDKGVWKFDPSMTIVATPDKSEESKRIYQAGVDWVIENKDAKYRYNDRYGEYLTDTEYYSGCAAGYTNLNWRINSIPKYYWGPAGDDISAYENWTSDDKDKARKAFKAFYDKIEERFAEVMSHALGKLYPNVKMIDGIDIFYTLQVMVYTEHIPSNTGKVTHAFEFKLVADGQFEYVRMYALAPEFELLRDENFQ